MAAVAVHCLAHQRSLFWLWTLQFDLGKEFDLPGQAFYGFDFDEFLATEFRAGPLNLLDAG